MGHETKAEGGWCVNTPGRVLAIGHDLALIDTLVDNHMQRSGVNRLPLAAEDTACHLTSTIEFNK